MELQSLLSTVKRRKLSWFGHAATILREQYSVDGSRCRVMPHKSWRDNIKEWTGQLLLSLLCITDDRSQWDAIAVEASVRVPRQHLGVMGVS